MDSSSSNTIGDLIIPLEDIVSATNNFSDENLIRRGGFGKVYKGQLRRSGQLIDIVARRLDPKYRKGEKEFFMEVEVLSTLKHENLATLIGFCDDKGEMIIINKLEPRGSLDKYLRDPTLTWMRRLEICVGVADALSYIHYDKGRDFSIIHRNIKSSKVLLDDKWKPKLSGFELSMKNTTARRHRLLSDDLCGTIGYIDPTYEKTGGVNHKSDVYSFGVVLFEVLCGRRAFNNTRSEGLSAQLDHVVVGNSDTMVDRPPELATDGVSDVDMRMFTLLPSSRFHYEERLGHLRIPDEQLLAPLAISHYEEKTLYDLIDPDLWKQMDPVSFSVFSKTAYDCLKEQRSDRPNIDEIVIRLREALDLQRKREKSGIPNEHSQVAGEVEGTLTNRLEWKKLEHLKMSYHDIKVATKNFSENCIGSGGFGKVYRAELEYFDTENSLETKEKNKHDLPKIRNTVAIKCLFKRKDTQAEKGFAAEIEILSSCKHPNVVSLIGFCDEKASDLILVYKYASNGSLDDHLRSFVKMTNLKWEQRLQLCLDIARGLNYLHTKQNIIHRDIKSDNILLDDNMVAKIADFGLSKIGPVPQHASYIETTVAGTIVYLDPEYEITQKLKKASDIYSLGVVLFEILSGSLAYNKAYMDKNPKGLAPCVRQHFQNGTLKDMVDPKLKGNLDENNLISTKGPNQDSLETFLDIAYQCIAETQTQRPKIGTVVKKLKTALQLQIEHEHLQISLEDIKEATNNFSIKNCIRGGGFGNIYIGEAIRADGSLITFAAKRLDSSYGEGETEFLTELEILLEYKHKNVIGLIGYCRQAHEKIIVYEYAPKGSLARHLANKDLTWRMRLEICIDIARGLEFLHGGGVTQEAMMHRDIKSSNILLGDDWKAKISDFGLSVIVSDSGDVIDKVCGTQGYCDPQYLQEGVFTKASDIYSFGVLLFEILCGILMFKITNGRIKILIDKFKRYYIKGKLDDMIFEGIKEQIVPQSLSAFQELANECVDDLRHKRPTTGEVLLRLEHSLHLQEDYGIWLPKLPSNYEEIFKMSSISETYFTKTKKDLHSMLSRGILLQKDQVLFSLGDNGETNEMISAQKFLYKHRQSRKWQSIPEESS